MRKILIVMPTMNVGGVERALISLLSVIPKERYAIDLVLSKKDGDFLKKIPLHVKIMEAPYKKNIRAGDGIGVILNNLKADKKYILWMKLLIAVMINKLFRVDKLISKVLYYNNDEEYNFLFNFAGVNSLSHILSKNVFKAHKKYIWVHGDTNAEEVVKYTDVYAKYDRIFCVSKAVTEKFKKYMPENSLRVENIYNEIDKKSILKQSYEDSGLHRESKEVILLTVGRLDVCKGYDIAIETCRRILNDGYNVKWYVIGEGAERDSLEAAIKRKNMTHSFILLGLKSNPYPYYRTTDIYVQTSISEGYCITLAEAKLFSKPIVTTNFSGADEQITNGKNGYIVSAKPSEIARSIEFLIDNEKKRIEFSNSLDKGNYVSSFGKLEQIMNNDMNI